MADERIVIELEAEDNASNRIDNVASSLGNLNSSATTVGNNNSAHNFLQKWQGGLNQFNSAVSQYNRIMSGFNRTVISLVKDAGAAVFDFTTDAINNFTKFTEEFSKTMGVMQGGYDMTTDAGKQSFITDSNSLKQQALQIATYGVDGTGSLRSPSEIAELQLALSKAGVTAETMLNTDVTSDVLKFAEANDLGTEQAVNFAVTLGNQYGVDYKDWGDMLDKVTHTADIAPINVSNIIESMKYASGISSGLNRSLEEVLGMTAIMGNFGLKGSQAGSGMQALFSRLLTGDTTVITDAQKEVAPPKALEAFYNFSNYAKSAGSDISYDDIVNERYTEEDITGNLRPMDEVVGELNEVMSDLDDEEQAWFAKKFFGLYQMKSAYALMNGDKKVDLQQVINEIANQSTDATDIRLDNILNSQYGKLTSLENLWTGVKTDVGDRLSPFVTEVRDQLFDFIGSTGKNGINFDGLHDALGESCDLLEEKYGSAIADAVRGLGDVTIDLSQVALQEAPELGKGLMEVFSSLFSGDIFGEDGVIQNWSEMIGNMHESANELPKELQDLGHSVADAVDWFGKLCAFNFATEFAQLISSLLQILTITGSAIINVAGMLTVNGTPTGGGGGGAGGAVAGASAGASSTNTTGAVVAGASASASASTLAGDTVVGSADDVARALGTATDDVIASFGEQASYTIDDIAQGLGESTDDVIRAYSSSIDDVISSGAGAVDDLARGSFGLFSKLSGIGKTVGAIGTAWQIGSGANSAYNNFKSGNTKAGVGDIGGTAGSVSGGYLGAEMDHLEHWLVL